MAERLRKRHQDEVRTKIQTSQLVNVLQNHALGTDEDKEITPTRMKAIEILLRKALPDLSSTEISGVDGGDIPIGVGITFVNADNSKVSE
jgi:hypothetical protein